MITIRHKKTGRLQEVTSEKFEAIRSRSRGWERVGETAAKPKRTVVIKPRPDVAEGDVDIE